MKKFYLLIIITFGYAHYTESQNLNQKHYDGLPPETVMDPYQYVDRNAMPKSEAYQRIAANYFTKQVNVDNQGNNIVGDAANEPSLAIDPTNPDRIVVGWRQFDIISSNFRQAGYGYSTNGGYNWKFPGVLEPGVFRSDPVLDFDNQGNFYYNSLQGTFDCDVFAIRDGGQTWGAAVPAGGGDKQWMTIDKTGGSSAGFNYSYWNSDFTNCLGGFIRSTDNAMSFEDCVTIPQEPIWGTLAVDADANLYLVGSSDYNAGDILVIKSTNASTAGSNISFETPTVVNLEGSLMAQPSLNPQGLLGQAWVDVDVSAGPGRDNVYVVASVDRNSIGDPADVMFARSTDGGASFSAPVRINTDSGTTAYQWFGTMAVAPNGRIDVVWLDTRDAPAGTFDSRLYYSFSEDQGDTWSENLAISEAFDPTIGYPQQQKMGDYFDMKSTDAFAHVAWCATFTGGQDVYYTKISPDGTLAVIENNFASNITIIPNPAKSITEIAFEASGETVVSVFDVLGREVTTLLGGIMHGDQKLTWNLTNADGNRVANGLYFLSVKSGAQHSTKKLLVR